MSVVRFVLVLVLAATATRAEGQMPPDLRPPDFDQAPAQFANQFLENMRKQQEAEAAKRREQFNEIVAWGREIWWALLVGGGAAAAAGGTATRAKTERAAVAAASVRASRDQSAEPGDARNTSESFFVEEPAKPWKESYSSVSLAASLCASVWASTYSACCRWISPWSPLSG